MPQEIELESDGTRLACWHLPATSEAMANARGRPCVVMGHGFAATRDAGLLPFAERFAEAGAEVLVFDYRGFGDSGGLERQHVAHWNHRRDYHAAVARARYLSEVDPERVVAWGSSYSGGHVLAVAARDRRIAAVISQGAAVDGLAATAEILRYAGPGQLLRLSAHALYDAAGQALGRAPHMIPAVGSPGSLAPISAPGAIEGYQSIMEPTFRNEMQARGVLGILANRPNLAAGKLSCPLLLVIAEQDNIAPPAAVRKVAETTGAEVLALPSGHFDIYTGELFDHSVAAQVDFLQRTFASG
jgi:pimeloyl-ACP methyl ester carboxylesterase